MDSDGNPTTNPLKAIAGMVLPMAGHKGFGLALMMDVLSGVLTGSQFGLGVHGPYEPEARSGCGHLMIAINIAALMPIGEFYQRMQHLITEIKRTPLTAGVEQIYYPGELEARNAQRFGTSGLILPGDTIADLQTLGEKLGLSIDR